MQASSSRSARLAAAELDELRVVFVRKAVLAGTDLRLPPAARRPAARADELARMTLGDAPPSPERERLRARRAELGLPSTDDSPLMVDPVDRGTRSAPTALPLHLQRARLTRVGVEANSGICRGMLRDRYSTAGIGEEIA